MSGRCQCTLSNARYTLKLCEVRWGEGLEEKNSLRSAFRGMRVCRSRSARKRCSHRSPKAGGGGVGGSSVGSNLKHTNTETPKQHMHSNPAAPAPGVPWVQCGGGGLAQPPDQLRQAGAAHGAARSVRAQRGPAGPSAGGGGGWHLTWRGTRLRFHTDRDTHRTWTKKRSQTPQKNRFKFIFCVVLRRKKLEMLP